MAASVPAQRMDEERPEPETIAGGETARLIVWAALVAAFLLFILFGSVPLHYILTANQRANALQTGQVPPASKRILQVWLDQADHLPHTAHPDLLRGFYYALLPVLLVAAAAALWFALMAVGRTRVTPPAPEAANGVAPVDQSADPLVQPLAEPIAGEDVEPPRLDEPA